MIENNQKFNILKDVLVPLIIMGALCATLMYIIALKSEIHSLQEYKANNELINAERDYCDACPICGNTVELHSTKDGKHWYIVCDSYHGGCGLHTGHEADVSKLVDGWNKICEKEKE